MCMARNAKDVYRDALALSDEERDELVRLLTQRDDEGWASPEIKQAWMEEIARRVPVILSQNVLEPYGRNVTMDIENCLE